MPEQLGDLLTKAKIRNKAKMLNPSYREDQHSAAVEDKIWIHQKVLNITEDIESIVIVVV